MNAALSIQGLHKRYGKHKALQGVVLAVPAGSRFGLVGPNGAGKTTAMMIVAGLLRPDGGRIDLLGQGSFQPPVHRGRVSLLPQDSEFPHHSVVEELLLYYARLQGLDRRAAARSTGELLEWVGLADRARSTVRSLSHGMVRRLAVAQAFLGEPELILLDEPTSGLDPRQVVQIRQLILSRRSARTVVVSSHNLKELETYCDHVAFIEAGRTIRQDSMEEITGRSRQITYRLVGGEIPLGELRDALPNAALRTSPGGDLLEVRYGGDGLDPVGVNAEVLRMLLERGCGVLEVRMGSDLEREYLSSTPEA